MVLKDERRVRKMVWFEVRDAMFTCGSDGQVAVAVEVARHDE
jgi:hypothetical protein